MARNGNGKVDPHTPKGGKAGDPGAPDDDLDLDALRVIADAMLDAHPIARDDEPARSTTWADPYPALVDLARAGELPDDVLDRHRRYCDDRDADGVWPCSPRNFLRRHLRDYEPADLEAVIR